jgi:hypothetical protein
MSCEGIIPSLLKMKSICFPSVVLAAISGFVLPVVHGAEFEADILPIFKSKCAKCHMDGNSKGSLSLEAAEIGGEIGSGKAIVPGDSEKSDLFHLVTLPEDDEDRMPPSGKGNPLSAGDVAKLKEWIESGASVGGESPEMKKEEKPESGMVKRPEPIDGSWTNRDGKVINATLLRVDGANAVLRMNGKEFSYPVGNLSEADQAKIREFAEAMKKAGG